MSLFMVVGLLLLMVVIPAMIGGAAQFIPALHVLHEKRDSLMVVLFIYMYHAHIVLLIVIVYVKTRFVINDLKGDPALQAQYGHGDDNHIEMVSKSNHSEASHKKEISLLIILSKNEYLESFMAHLAREC